METLVTIDFVNKKFRITQMFSTYDYGIIKDRFFKKDETLKEFVKDSSVDEDDDVESWSDLTISDYKFLVSTILQELYSIDKSEVSNSHPYVEKLRGFLAGLLYKYFHDIEDFVELLKIKVISNQEVVFETHSVHYSVFDMHPDRDFKVVVDNT